MTIQGVAQLLILAKKIHNGIEDSEENVLLWCSLLNDFSDEIGFAALHQHLSHSIYQPRPADINRIADTMREDRPPLAEAAWREVLSKLNQYVKPEWSHPLIEKAVRSMGFLNLCLSTTPDYDRTQFIKTYESFKQREKQDEMNMISMSGSKRISTAVNGEILRLSEKFGA